MLFLCIVVYSRLDISCSWYLSASESVTVTFFVICMLYVICDSSFWYVSWDSALHEMARCSLIQGRYRDSEDLFRETLSIKLTYMPESHINIAFSNYCSMSTNLSPALLSITLH